MYEETSIIITLSFEKKIYREGANTFNLHSLQLRF